MEKNKKEKYTFEEALKRLEEIVSKLETSEVPLEETINLFEEGMELVKFCNQKLEEVKHKVEMVVKTKDGFTLKPFVEKPNDTVEKEKKDEEEDIDEEELPF
ncbi:MAG: exodeoxyribonuclease VII small subunit [Elusimicrobiota bacterium]|nr:exodeoxyribonuclease VII small subunit [Endomicrobiia bacterium]MDW8165335.1 exodeoxyribonuclease VII small subunit [Elusimicrobiota bacterium]